LAERGEERRVAVDDDVAEAMAEAGGTSRGTGADPV
jgi:hypothetical protein